MAIGLEEALRNALRDAAKAREDRDAEIEVSDSLRQQRDEWKAIAEGLAVQLRAELATQYPAKFRVSCPELAAFDRKEKP